MKKDDVTFEVAQMSSAVSAAAHPTCSNALVEDLFDGE